MQDNIGQLDLALKNRIMRHNYNQMNQKTLVNVLENAHHIQDTAQHLRGRCTSFYIQLLCAMENINACGGQ